MWKRYTVTLICALIRNPFCRNIFFQFFCRIISFFCISLHNHLKPFHFQKLLCKCKLGSYLNKTRPIFNDLGCVRRAHYHIYTNIYSRIPVNNHITANEYVFWTYYYVSFHFNVLKQRIRKLVKSTTLTLHILKIKSRLNLKLSEDSWLIIDYHLVPSRSLHSRVKKEAIFGLFLRSLFLVFSSLLK